MSETKRARCPVCSRVVTVTSSGRLRSHGNRMHASWEQCRQVGREVNVRRWETDEDGVLVAPGSLGASLWDVRAVVEHWAPNQVSRAQITRLAALLREQWDELNRALVAERRLRRSAVTRARNSRALDAETVHRLVEPVVGRQMQGYADPDQVTQAVVQALMQWVEGDHEQD